MPVDKNLVDTRRYETSRLAFVLVSIANLNRLSQMQYEEKNYIFWTEEREGGALLNFMPETTCFRFTKDLRIHGTPKYGRDAGNVETKIMQYPELDVMLTAPNQALVTNQSLLRQTKNSCSFILLKTINGYPRHRIIYLNGEIVDTYMPLTRTDPNFTVRVKDAHEFENFDDLLVHKMTKKLIGDLKRSMDDINTDYLKGLFRKDVPVVKEKVEETKEPQTVEAMTQILGDFFQ